MALSRELLQERLNDFLTLSAEIQLQAGELWVEVNELLPGCFLDDRDFSQLKATSERIRERLKPVWNRFDSDIVKSDEFLLAMEQSAVRKENPATVDFDLNHNVDDHFNFQLAGIIAEDFLLSCGRWRYLRRAWKTRDKEGSEDDFHNDLESYRDYLTAVSNFEKNLELKRNVWKEFAIVRVASNVDSGPDQPTDDSRQLVTLKQIAKQIGIQRKSLTIEFIESLGDPEVVLRNRQKLYIYNKIRPTLTAKYPATDWPDVFPPGKD